MKKAIPGFSADVKPGKIPTNGSKQHDCKSQPLVGSKGGKGGMPEGGEKPSKV